MADLAWWQTIVSGAAGGALTLFGQLATKKRELRAQEWARIAARTEAVDDRRRVFELERLEELRQALLEADDVASHGRRLRKRRLAEASGFSALSPINRMTEGLQGTLPIDEVRAERFGPALLALRGAIAVTLDDEVRAAAQSAYDYLNTGKSNSDRPVGTALDVMGKRLRKIQGKVK